MNLGAGTHLCYCTNIHPGETWAEVQANLQTHVLRVRAQVSPHAPFGIGLRLSAAAAATLAEPETLADFRRFLDDHGCYVFTLNGFPYGAFHGTRVKEAVYEPDWRSPLRLEYSNRLADILADLLPADGSIDGSISTVPGGHQPRLRSPADVECVRRNLVAHAAYLLNVRRRTGRCIRLALEPEPCCFLETTDEAVEFFRRSLFAAVSVQQLADMAGIDHGSAATALRAHLGLCLDLCHAAVEFEDPGRCVAILADAGIRIGKLQVSAGLSVASFDEAAIAELRRFADPVYLHQVVERDGPTLRRYADLPEALATLDEPRARDEWRVHFHVPVFAQDVGVFRSTRGFVEAVLAQHRLRPVSTHLEVETYTWDVLPASLRALPIDAAIARELTWVREVLAA